MVVSPSPGLGLNYPQRKMFFITVFLDACAVMHHNGKTLHASTFRWQIADCLINLQHCAPVDMLLTHEQANKIIVESVSKTPYCHYDWLLCGFLLLSCDITSV